MQFPILIERAPICSTPNLAIYLQHRYLSCLAGGMNAPAVPPEKQRRVSFSDHRKVKAVSGNGYQKTNGF
jgi:hypothetical protein